LHEIRALGDHIELLAVEPCWEVVNVLGSERRIASAGKHVYNRSNAETDEE
jgi:hypothetical protein